MKINHYSEIYLQQLIQLCAFEFQKQKKKDKGPQENQT